MNFARLLEIVVARLEAAGIPHMTTGSFASGHYGPSRSTFDLDIVIDPDARSLDIFVRSFANEPDFYVSEIAAKQALRSRGMFNLLQHSSGLKVDFIIVKERPFSRTEFARRVPATLLGVATNVVTAEDSILSKLEWSQAGESQRQFDDACNVAKSRGANLDHAYLRRWATELNLGEPLERLLREAGDPEEA